MIVKICGFTRGDDVKIACDLGVDMIGVILVEGSKRQVSIERAKKILSMATVKRVVVCKPNSPSELVEFDHKLNPDYVQLHPSLKSDELEKIKGKISAGMILVLPIPAAGASLDKLKKEASQMEKIADFVLLDTKGPHGGGTGIAHDWNISRELTKCFKTKVLLAGGLSPQNVADAIQTVKPDGVDVATGVETSPGVKDPELMREFIKLAKEASA